MLQSGAQFDRYDILGPIAAGGMGVVYRARHRLLQTEVAIKVLSSHLSLDERVRTRFAQEAYVQAQLEHPGIVAVQDFVDHEGQLAIVMRLVQGPSLEQVMGQELPGPWPVERVRQVMLPVLEAVAYAHQRGIVHRDLKPGNILLDRKDGGFGVPKVTDFGLAKILASEGGLEQATERHGVA